MDRIAELRNRFMALDYPSLEYVRLSACVAVLLKIPLWDLTFADTA